MISTRQQIVIRNHFCKHYLLIIIIQNPHLFMCSPLINQTFKKRNQITQSKLYLSLSQALLSSIWKSTFLNNQSKKFGIFRNYVIWKQWDERNLCEDLFRQLEPWKKPTASAPLIWPSPSKSALLKYESNRSVLFAISGSKISW